MVNQGKQRNSGQEHGTVIKLQATTADKQQLKHRGSKTQANKLTPGD